MQVLCAHCSRPLEYSGERPSFCGFCGQPIPKENEEVTAAYGPSTHRPLLEAAAPSAARGTGACVAPGQIVGGYRLLKALGSGGMGTVYEAEDVISGRRVAVKLIAA